MYGLYIGIFSFSLDPFKVMYICCQTEKIALTDINRTSGVSCSRDGKTTKAKKTVSVHATLMVAPLLTGPATACL